MLATLMMISGCKSDPAVILKQMLLTSNLRYCKHKPPTSVNGLGGPG